MATAKPHIAIPAGAPPADLEIVDLVVGDGEEALSDSRVAVHYLGVAWSTHAEFDSSFEQGEPFIATLGRKQVIAGWDAGVPGMRVGGRRQLTIPPHLAYGSQGAGLFVRPNETLVFVIELERVDSTVNGSGAPRRFGFRRRAH